MTITMMKSKIHRATVTDADLTYEGSITIDKNLCEMADMLPNERVDIYNCNSGARFSTYVIWGKEGEICLNGAAARHVQPSDKVIIVSYAQMTREEAEQFDSKVVLVNDENKPK